MNEGHSSLLTLALLEEELRRRRRRRIGEAHIEAVREQCVFTTHTPVPAGHDQFPKQLVEEVLGAERTARLEAAEAMADGTLNMTYLGLRFSHYINGVSMRHGEVSVGMFPEYPVQAITNGVHVTTWTSPHLGRLFDHYMPGWKDDNRYLRYAIKIPLNEIREVSAAIAAAVAEVAYQRGLATKPKPDDLLAHIEAQMYVPRYRSYV